MDHIYSELAYEAGTKRHILENARKTFERTFEDAPAIISFLDSGRIYDDRGNICYKESFMGKMAKAFDTYGKLTVKQVEAVRRILEKTMARKAEWTDKQANLDANRKHIGVVGKRMTLTVTVKKIIEIDCIPFSRWDPAYTLINILEDADQNVLIYKGRSLQGLIGEGETIELTFTPKDHGVRNGVKQTIISRPKIK